ncbi:PREDICTED: pre-mRNA-splicing factor cwc22-like [Chinchilla lanigera]|uniref:pre-mRNA-splicing factor cwc22-like n=1 Tax=Chinchilla lanigera TaxID=34839 RepID=UPI000695E08D|nr:PREDICTED: pre-mRNA-splicing factor cwc22-like [Chinchilla lanigera]
MQGRWVQAPAPELSRGPRAGWVCRSFRAECLGGKRDAGSGLRGSSARVSRPASRERGLHAAPKPKFSSRVGATQRQTKRRPDRRSAPRGRAPPGEFFTPNCRGVRSLARSRAPARAPHRQPHPPPPRHVTRPSFSRPRLRPRPRSRAPAARSAGEPRS